MRMELNQSFGNTDEETLHSAQTECYRLFVRSLMEVMSRGLEFLMLLSKKSKRSWTGTQGYKQEFLFMKFMCVEVFLEPAYRSNNRHFCIMRQQHDGICNLRWRRFGVNGRLSPGAAGSLGNGL